jgi:hypothetical protein
MSCNSEFVIIIAIKITETVFEKTLSSRLCSGEHLVFYLGNPALFSALVYFREVLSVFLFRLLVLMTGHVDEVSQIPQLPNLI